MESIKKHIKGEKFIFDKSGSIFLENLNTLIFSDLHLGKVLVLPIKEISFHLLI